MADQPKQYVILLRGLPGMGKTTLAKGLCRRLGCPLVCKDDIRDSLEGLEKRMNPKLTALGSTEFVDTNPYCYDVMCMIATTQLQCGQSVIMESPMGTPERYNQFCDVAEKFGAVPLVIDCNMDLPAWKKRLHERLLSGTEPDHKPHDPEKILQYYGEKIKYPLGRGPSLSLDMIDPVERLVEQVHVWIRQLPK